MARSLTPSRPRRRSADSIDLAAQPAAAIELVQFLDGRTSDAAPFPLEDIPKGLQDLDLLRFGMAQWLVRIVAYCGANISSASGLIGTTFQWVDYGQAGYPVDLGEAMLQDQQQRDPKQRLHIRLTYAAIDACVEYRVRLRDRPPPDDLMTLTVASSLYHITPKGLREAIHNPSRALRDYRPAGAPANAPMLVSEREVAKLWPKRDS